LGYAALFVVYDWTLDSLLKFKSAKQATNMDMLISGGLGGIACWTIGYPQDVIPYLDQDHKNHFTM
jgi:solute carrier family 25 carnitine/acylcarnitine transporter 20/29